MTRTAFSKASSLCIVGGGYIGLEVAAVAKSAGLDVHVLEMESRILQRVTTESMNAFYHDLHTSRGVTIHTETACSGFVGEQGQVTGVHVEIRSLKPTWSL